MIENGSPAYREWLKGRRGKKSNFVIDPVLGSAPCLECEKKAASVKERFSSQEKAEQRAEEIGCVGAHQVGVGFWSPCEDSETLNAHRGTKNRVTRLLRAARRRPRRVLSRPMNRGVETLPGGGLVSAKDDTD